MNLTIISHNFTGKSLVVVGRTGTATKTKIISASHPNWQQVIDLYKEKKLIELFPIMDMDKAIAAKFNGEFYVKEGKVYYNGEVAHGYLIDRILHFMREMPSQSDRLLAFARNLYSNPDKKVIANLFQFLEHKNMPLTEDGCFLAYKGVRPDYYSITGGSLTILKGKVDAYGRIFNGVGEKIVAKRGDVCSDENEGCARGIHVGSYDYANAFRKSDDGKLMVLKVNPKNVVVVPKDCNYSKVRACEYDVIAEEDGRLNEVLDSNFDKQPSVKPLTRDALGRFCRTTK